MSDVLFLLVLVAPIAGIWWLLIRPAQRRAQAAAQLSASVTVGQHVVTTSGLFGTVTGLDDRTVRLQVAPGVELQFDRRAIGRVLGPEDDPGEASGDGSESDI
jgi:preprotein translocase subunit YajC